MPEEIFERMCIICGKLFTRRKSQLFDGRGKYCSRKCSAIGRSKEVEIVCAVCGIKVKVKESDISNGRGMYCSLKCKGIASRRKIPMQCDSCGKDILVWPYKMQRERHYCSNECRFVGTTGENHPQWMGGISFEPYCKKFNDKLKEAIRERFGRRCFLCGEKENGKRLDIHHIDYDKNDICNGKSWPLIPLCKSCHSKTRFNEWHWFNLLMNYWAMNIEINWKDMWLYE